VVEKSLLQPAWESAEKAPRCSRHSKAKAELVPPGSCRLVLPVPQVALVFVIYPEGVYLQRQLYSLLDFNPGKLDCRSLPVRLA